MKGYSIHIGVNKVDQSHYGGITDLRAAVFDAKDMLKLSTETFGYENLAFLTDDTATSKNVLNAFALANERCQDGDILLVSYSGHGSLIEDIWRNVTPDELIDQTWCLYDRQLIDDEIKYAFSQIKKKIRILVVSDSCHSGSVVRSMALSGSSTFRELIIPGLNMSMSDFCRENDLVEKKVPLEKSQEIQGNNMDFYKEILDNTPHVEDPDSMDASVLLLAACEDDEVTFDGRRNGRFTHTLKYVLGNFPISSPQFIIDKISSYYEYPHPKITDYGAASNFRSKGNPFLIVPDINPEDTSTDDANDGDDEEEPRIDPTPEPNSNIIVLSSENGELNLGVIAQLYDGEIKSILSISKHSMKIELPDNAHIWNTIHSISRNSDQNGYDIIAEPATSRGFEIKDHIATRAPGSETDFMVYWPPFDRTQNMDRNWHLGPHHSQLADARNHVQEKIRRIGNPKPVRIGHLDTGWDPYHPLLRDNNFIRADLARSFVKGEENNDLAEDYRTRGGEQQGHGTGTLGLISGGHINADGKQFGKLGAAPFIEVIPIRVTDTVIIIDNECIVKGIEYAISQDCDVITMSLGGKPSIKMAKAINKAYEKGIVVVAAAGNCIVQGIAQIGPRKLVFPAKFDRVIAACGATYNQKPYDFKAQEDRSPIRSLSTRFMQGNWGPKRAMKTALAAYTPNVPWLTSSGDRSFVQSGGGTSSATPQIASAVALWLAFYQQELITAGIEGWKRVEAVRKAIFGSANNDYSESEKYYGNGVLRAYDALQISPDTINDLTKSKKAKASPFGIYEVIDLFVNRFRTTRDGYFSEKELESISLELTHIIEDLNIEKLNDLSSTEEGVQIDPDIINQYREEILARNPSEDLIKLAGL